MGVATKKKVSRSPLVVTVSTEKWRHSRSPENIRSAGDGGTAQHSLHEEVQEADETPGRQRETNQSAGTAEKGDCPLKRERDSEFLVS